MATRNFPRAGPKNIIWGTATAINAEATSAVYVGLEGVGAVDLYGTYTLVAGTGFILKADCSPDGTTWYKLTDLGEEVVLENTGAATINFCYQLKDLPRSALLMRFRATATGDSAGATDTIIMDAYPIVGV